MVSVGKMGVPLASSINVGVMVGVLVGARVGIGACVGVATKELAGKFNVVGTVGRTTVRGASVGI